MTPADITAVLLVGGLGTRLRSVVPDKPKALASVGGRPFIDLVLEQLARQGFRRIVLCTGYLADQMERELSPESTGPFEIHYSREEAPLGTAGAVKLAQPLLRETPAFLVLNGDSFVEMDFARFLTSHESSAAFASIAGVHVADAARYGTLEQRSDHRLSRFAEKTGTHQPGLINGGVYLFDRRIFGYIPEGRANFETDVFPRILELGVHVEEQHGIFIDIGVPEDYARAQQLAERLKYAACS